MNAATQRINRHPAALRTALAGGAGLLTLAESRPAPACAVKGCPVQVTIKDEQPGSRRAGAAHRPRAAHHFQCGLPRRSGSEDNHRCTGPHRDAEHRRQRPENGQPEFVNRRWARTITARTSRCSTCMVTATCASPHLHPGGDQTPPPRPPVRPRDAVLTHLRRREQGTKPHKPACASSGTSVIRQRWLPVSRRPTFRKKILKRSGPQKRGGQGVSRRTCNMLSTARPWRIRVLGPHDVRPRAPK